MVHNSQSEQEVHKFIGMPDFNIAVISMTRRYRIDSWEHSRRFQKAQFTNSEKKSTGKWKQSISTGLLSPSTGDTELTRIQPCSPQVEIM